LPGELPANRSSPPAPSRSRTAASSTRNSAGRPAAVSSRWIEIVSRLKERQPALGAVLEQGVPVEVSEERLEIAFREKSFFGQQAAEESAREAIVTAAEKVLGRYPELKIAFCADIESVGASVVQERDEQREQELEQTVMRALEHPLVREAIEIFPEASNNVDVQVEDPAEPRR